MQDSPILYEKRSLISRSFSKFVSPGKVKFYSKYGLTFIPGHRDGCYIFDVNGKRFFNAHCNGGVFNLGHRNHNIIETLKEALTEYDIGNHHLISEPRARLGELFARHLPGDMNKVIYGVSGGEAIDTAIKLARGYTRKPGIISIIGGYHGHTGLALAAGDETFRLPFGPLSPGFVQVPFNDLKEIEKTIDQDTAAVIMETIPATLGMPIPSKEYLQGIRQLCDTYGALFIVDEIQTGLGRTGKLWAIEHFDVIPDILVTGKGLSGGIYPITATCYRDKYTSFFEEHPFIHVSTFGGSELGCMVAIAVLKATASPDFLDEVNEKADYLNKALVEIMDNNSDVFMEIRQKGLFVGLKFFHEEFTAILCKALFDEGLYAIYAANDKSVLQFLPPLIATKEDLDAAILILDKALKKMRSKLKYKMAKSLYKHFNKKSPTG